MAQFKVYKLDECLVVDVQSDMVIARGMRAVIPLAPESAGNMPLSGLEGVFSIDDGPHILLTAEIAAVPEKALGPPVADLRGEQDRGERALDFLFYGF